MKILHYIANFIKRLFSAVLALVILGHILLALGGGIIIVGDIGYKNGSWWFWPAYVRELERFGLGSAILSAYSYLVFYCSLIALPYLALNDMYHITSKYRFEALFICFWFAFTFLAFLHPVVRFLEALPSGWLLLVWISMTALSYKAHRSLQEKFEKDNPLFAQRKIEKLEEDIRQLKEKLRGAREITKETRVRLEKVLGDFRNKLTSVHTGRASISLLNNITAEYYGTEMPLNQLATINVPEPSLLTVQPFDSSIILVIEKSLRNFYPHLNPFNDGKLIHVPIPPLDEPHSRQVVRFINKIVEEHKRTIYEISNASAARVMAALKKKVITEDEKKDGLDEIQKLLDQHFAEIMRLGRQKENEIRLA